MSSLSCSKNQSAQSDVSSKKAKDEALASLSPNDRPFESNWLYHPRQKQAVVDAIKLDSGELLQVDEGGGRWLKAASKAPRASAYVAPEKLVGFVQDAARTAAVGQSGAVYFFEDALGPFVEIRKPSQIFVQTVISGKTLLSLSDGGELYRSSDVGRSHHKLQLKANLSSIHADAEGHIYALAVPERWFFSDSGSSPFRRLEVQSVAPISQQMVRNQLLVHGLFGSHTLGREGWAPPVQPQARDAVQSLAEFARPETVSSGRALFDDLSYFSLLPQGEKKFLWKHGHLAEALQSESLTRPSGCSSYRLIGSPERPYVLCLAETLEASPAFSIYAFDSKNKSLTQRRVSVRGDWSELKGDVSEDHTLALRSVCAPYESEKGCSARGAVLLKKGAEEPEFIQLPGDPELLDLRFVQGAGLWALAKRKKDQHLLLWGPLDSEPVLIDLSAKHENLRASEGQVAKLLPGSQGLLTVVSRGHGALFVSAVNAKERALLSTMQAPPGVSSISGSGRYLAALGADGKDYFQSKNGGLSWSEEELPRPLCSSEEDCEAELLCSEAGCLVGSELIHLGYESQGEVNAEVLDHERENPPWERESLGLACELVESNWTLLPGLLSVPTARDAFLGDAAWSAVLSDANTASASAVFARLKKSEVEKKELFAPVADPQNYAMKVSLQVEGSAALRARLPLAGSSAFGSVELAWDNRIEDLTGRASLPAGEYPLEIASQAEASKLARPELLSVAGRGLYLQFQPGEGKGRRTYFFQAGHQLPEMMPAFSWPKVSASLLPSEELSALAQGAREERVVVHGENGALLLLAGERIVVRAFAQSSTESSVQAMLMGQLQKSDRAGMEGVQLAYRGKDIGFVSVRANATGSSFSAEFVALGKEQAFEEAEAAPLQAHLAERSLPCSEVQRESTARMVVPWYPAPPRNVAVHGLQQGPLQMKTDDAVLFGSPEQPCLATWEAKEKRALYEGMRFFALISPDQKAVSWLFRVKRQGFDAEQASAHPMTCSFE